MTTTNDTRVEAVRAAIARWFAAVDARDVERITSFYSEDGVACVSEMTCR